MLKTFERNHAVGTGGNFRRQMKPVDGVKKKQRTDAFVKIFAAAAKCVQLRAGRKQFGGGSFRADGVERLVADFWIRRRDDFKERMSHAKFSGVPARAVRRDRQALRSAPDCSRPARVGR